MQKIAFVGSSELCGRLQHYFESTGFGITVGMFDDFEETGTVKHDRPILGNLAAMPGLFRKGAFDTAAVAIGYKHMSFRKEVFSFLQSHAIPVTTFVHPSSHVEPSAIIKEGCIVLVDCTIDLQSVLHENVLLSSRCFVSHDVQIRSHTYCAPALNLAGHTTVGECSFLGIGATTIDGVRIGDHTRVAAGSVLTKDAPPGVLMAGVPAVIKKHYR